MKKKSRPGLKKFGFRLNVAENVDEGKLKSHPHRWMSVTIVFVYICCVIGIYFLACRKFEGSYKNMQISITSETL